MSSLLSTTEKSEVESLFDDLHDTFYRNVYVYYEKAASVDLDSSYNPLYGRRQSENESAPTLERTTVQARILYPKPHDERTLEDTGLTSTENVVRLKVRVADAPLFHSAKWVDVDGEKYSVVTKPNVVGPFSLNYSNVYLRRDT